MTAADRPQMPADLPTHDAHLAGDHSLCSAEWCAFAVRPEPTRELRESPGEAGIASEENLPGLTPQERDDFLGGAA